MGHVLLILKQELSCPGVKPTPGPTPLSETTHRALDQQDTNSPVNSSNIKGLHTVSQAGVGNYRCDPDVCFNLRLEKQGTHPLSLDRAKTRLGADCGSDHELLIAKFRLKLKKVGKTTRPFRYDLNQIPYN